MKTHILYSTDSYGKRYFSGTYEGKKDADGFAIITFRWSIRIKHATALDTALAWDLLSMCRINWPHLTLDVQRIVTLEQIQAHFIRS